jgi:hypothetical protein
VGFLVDNSLQLQEGIDLEEIHCSLGSGFDRSDKFDLTSELLFFGWYSSLCVLLFSLH